MDSEPQSPAEARDHRRFCDEQMRRPIHTHDAASLNAVWAAAMRSGHAEARDWVVTAAIRASLPPEGRVRLALRLAHAMRAEDAFGVLLADPDVFSGEAAKGEAVSTLRLILLNNGTPEWIREVARMLGRRLCRVSDDGGERTGFVFPVQSPLLPAAYPCEVLLAPGAPPSAGPAIERHLHSIEDALVKAGTPEVRLYRDVLVNREGQMWRADGSMIRSEWRVLPEASRIASATAPRVEEAVLAICPNNVYHWFTDWMTSIAWRFADGVPDLPVLVRDDAPPYVPESLELAGGSALSCIPVGDAVAVGRLYVTGRPGVRLDPEGAAGGLFRKMVAAALDGREPPRTGPVYISRRDARRRKAANDEALEDALVAEGIRPITLTEMSLRDRIVAMRGATAIVSQHGAGLCMIFAAPPGTPVFEVLPHMAGTLRNRLCFARMSRMLGHRHRIWLEDCDQQREYWTADVPRIIASAREFLAG
ncbi:glycosyltransferase family 61 protein [Roseomonas sp. HJA6]|uniref:Glycosyltransferase family 61 protein n=1 Tax=Roseomonas alba TaxID=2846776 RepID=A0ABS7A4D8_9PROT|nr:glycosyltransferase family 61 protein [Neoroseomonas alba]MBW6397169.1 glycosyltransferase family 61 protein [Neoroseomonas alba]